MICSKAWHVGLAGMMLFCVFGLRAGDSQAALIPGLNQQFPDLTAGYISVSFSAETGSFSAQGYGLSLATSPSPSDLHTMNFPAYQIFMTLNASGVPSSGSLLVSGPATISDIGSFGDPLLTGALSQFGFGNASQPLEFIFNVTGGALQSPYFPSQIGVLLHDSGFGGGTFGSDFTNDGQGTSDNFFVPSSSAPIPEPSMFVTSMGLMILSGLAYLFRSRFVARV